MASASRREIDSLSDVPPSEGLKAKSSRHDANCLTACSPSSDAMHEKPVSSAGGPRGGVSVFVVVHAYEGHISS